VTASNICCAGGSYLVNTYGIKHDQLPPETNGLVSDLFFGLDFVHFVMPARTAPALQNGQSRRSLKK
jgi:hypothetical protein